MSKALFASLEGKGFGNKERASGRNRGLLREEGFGGSFIFIIQNPPNLVEL